MPRETDLRIRMLKDPDIRKGYEEETAAQAARKNPPPSAEAIAFAAEAEARRKNLEERQRRAAAAEKQSTLQPPAEKPVSSALDKESLHHQYATGQNFLPAQREQTEEREEATSFYGAYMELGLRQFFKERTMRANLQDINTELGALTTELAKLVEDIADYEAAFREKYGLSDEAIERLLGPEAGLKLEIKNGKKSGWTRLVEVYREKFSDYKAKKDTEKQLTKQARQLEAELNGNLL